jgi:hypothetical protein
LSGTLVKNNGKDKNLGEEIKKTHTCQPLKVKNQAALD